MLELTLGTLLFVFAILFVAFMAPKRSDKPRKLSPKSPDENKKDSDSANDAPGR
jgi:hypothetical protein